MNINATLLGQMITFALFVYVTMKWIWPPIMHAMSERQKQIADGLEAAEQGKLSLEKAREDMQTMLHDAKTQAQSIIDEANQRASHIINEAKNQSKIEGQRLVDKAKTEIDLQVQQARESLRKQVASIALMGAEKILQKEISQATNDGLVDQLIEELR